MNRCRLSLSWFYPVLSCPVLSCHLRKSPVKTSRKYTQWSFSLCVILQPSISASSLIKYFQGPFLNTINKHWIEGPSLTLCKREI
jgi:hypothetical protein